MLAISIGMSDSDQPGRHSLGTTKRAGEFTNEQRADIARKLADRRAVSQPVFQRPGLADAEEAERAQEAARVAAELSRVERRLNRLERASSGGGRYQMGEAAAPTGRYARLLSRADRLERKLNRLR